MDTTRENSNAVAIPAVSAPEDPNDDWQSHTSMQSFVDSVNTGIVKDIAA